MQTGRDEVLRQQLVLKETGFYIGPLDGLWGPQSIQAMQKFENCVAKYRPARPTGGLPFGDTGPLPAGLWREGNLICCDGVTAVTDAERSLRAAAAAQCGRAKPAIKEDDKPESSTDDGVKSESVAVESPIKPHVNPKQHGQKNSGHPHQGSKD